MNFDLVFDDFCNHFEPLIKDVEIKPCDSDNPINLDDSPFNNHLYISVLIKDEAAVTDPIQTYTTPMAFSMARALKRLQMVETQPLGIPDGRTGIWAKLKWAGNLHVRCSANYDLKASGYRLWVDLLARQIGNHYRMIINGPLHGHMMPFKYEPQEYLRYLHMPVKRPNYFQAIYDEKGNWVDEKLLPGLDKGAMHPEYFQTYKIDGDYCYYQGEEIRPL
jgi:hypothetical protein